MLPVDFVILRLPNGPAGRASFTIIAFLCRNRKRLHRACFENLNSNLSRSEAFCFRIS